MSTITIAGVDVDTRHWIGGQRVALLPFLLLLHGGVMLLALLWLLGRHANWHWQDWRQLAAGRRA